MAQVNDFFLNNFMSEFKGGSRPNQFKAEVAVPARLRGLIPNANLGLNKMKFMIKAASLPPSTIGNIDVPFRGRQFKVPGDRTFQEWQVTVVNDVDSAVRDLFEHWMDLIVGNVNHDEIDGTKGPIDYMASGDINQLNRNGKIIKGYKFIGIWPSNIGEIATAFDANDQVEEFPVTFQYQWWESNTTRNNTGADKFARTGGQSVV